MSSIRDTLGKFIWDTSRGEGGSMSYIGANVIADAILAKFEVSFTVESDYGVLTENAEYQEYQAYKAANRGRLQAYAVQRIINRALDPEMED